MGRICLAVKGETGIEWSHLTPTTLKISAGPLVGSATNPSLVTIEIPVLGPGETYDFSAAITMGMATLLPETLFLRVDPGNTVSERDLLNNLAVVAVVGEPQISTAIEDVDEPAPPIPPIPSLDHDVFFYLPAVLKLRMMLNGTRRCSNWHRRSRQQATSMHRLTRSSTCLPFFSGIMRGAVRLILTESCCCVVANCSILAVYCIQYLRFCICLIGGCNGKCNGTGKNQS